MRQHVRGAFSERVYTVLEVVWRFCDAPKYAERAGERLWIVFNGAFLESVLHLFTGVLVQG